MADYYCWDSALGRPSIPERPADDPGSADEDNDEELPQIVVLKEGKHLSATEVENERRKSALFFIVLSLLFTDGNCHNCDFIYFVMK